MADRDTQIRDALNPLFLWSHEPALVSGAVTAAIIATINYLELTGQYVMDDALLGLVIAWIGVISLVVRSQYEPWANKVERGKV